MINKRVNNTLLYVILIVMKEFFRIECTKQDYKTYEVVREYYDSYVMRTGLVLA